MPFSVALTNVFVESSGWNGVRLGLHRGPQLKSKQGWACVYKNAGKVFTGYRMERYTMLNSNARWTGFFLFLAGVTQHELDALLVDVRKGCGDNSIPARCPPIT